MERTTATETNQGAGTGSLDALGPIRWWALVALVAAAVYLPTAAYGPRQITDTAATAIQSYTIARHGDPDVGRYAGTPQSHLAPNGWRVTDRTPGPVGVGAVAYELAGPWLPDREPDHAGRVPLWPAGAASALVAAATVATLASVFRELVGTRAALVAAGVAGLATATWSVSANALWTHTITQLGIAVAALSYARARSLGAAVGFGLAAAARQHTAAIAAVSGIATAWQRRSWRHLALVGLGTAAGLGLLGLYYGWLTGSFSPLGVGSYESRAGNLAGGGRGPLWIPVTFAMTFVSPSRGSLMSSPFLWLLLPAVPTAWRVAPTWVRWLAVGGLVQLVIQVTIQPQWMGGDAYFSYRLQLEFLTACAPLLVLGYRHWLAHRPQLVRPFWAAVGLSVVWHALGATVLSLGALPG